MRFQLQVSYIRVEEKVRVEIHSLLPLGAEGVAGDVRAEGLPRELDKKTKVRHTCQLHISYMSCYRSAPRT